MLNHLDRSNPSSAVDGWTLSTELIDYAQHPDLVTISIFDKDKVIAPKMIRGSSSQGLTAAIVNPQLASRGGCFYLIFKLSSRHTDDLSSKRLFVIIRQ